MIEQQIETGLHLKRPCIIVRDLDRALTIYQDILGFKLDYRSPADPDSYLYSVFKFPKNANLAFAALSTDYEPRSLALTEVKGIELASPSLPHRIATVIRVESVTSIIEQIRPLNLDIVAPNYFTAPPNLFFTEQAFCDYDNNLIVIYDVKIKE
ncbi:MAG: hypothetical protein Tsb0014_38320 [Pleurocapsa sp.]